MTTFRRLSDDLKRSPEIVVPPVYRFLFQPKRYKVCYGGRGGGRSWNFGRALVVRAAERRTRILCAREIQSSITESVHRLLANQIELLGYSDQFEIQQYAILGKNGSEFIFVGLRTNVTSIKSLEGVDIVWVEEAENISADSWTKLSPTIRTESSEIWVTFNPHLKTDPTYKKFVISPPANAIVVKTTFADNPHFPAVLEDERLYLQSVDDDAYRHVWLGECKEVSDALILKNKFTVESFEVERHWSGPHYGLDFGFSRDPSAAVELWIDDTTKTLYVKREYWALGTDIDALPGALECAIPGISQYTVFCDSSRPESISYLARNGVSGARAVEKWNGSIIDGISYLRAFQQIVIDPACKHFADEARNYSYRCDRLSGLPLPEPEDKNNHLIDGARYALSPLIRNIPSLGFFSRSALFVNGEPDEMPVNCHQIYGVIAATERLGSAVALVIFAIQHTDMPRRVWICDYDLVEISEAFTIEWLGSVHERIAAVAKQCKSLWLNLYVEKGDFSATMCNLAIEHSSPISLYPVDIVENNIPATLDERASMIRAEVNGLQVVKFWPAAYEREVTHRNTTTNHLLAQVLAYRAGAPEMPQELAAAFCFGVAISKGRESR